MFQPAAEPVTRGRRSISRWKVMATPRQTASRSHAAGANGLQHTPASICVKIAGRPQYPLPSRQRFGHDTRKQRCHISRQRFGHHARSTRCHIPRQRIGHKARSAPLPSRQRFGHHPRSGRCHIPRQRVGHNARSARCHPGNVWELSLWLLCLTRPHHVSRKTRDYLERKGSSVNFHRTR
jgi:hypothetical protein